MIACHLGLDSTKTEVEASSLHQKANDVFKTTLGQVSAALQLVACTTSILTSAHKMTQANTVVIVYDQLHFRALDTFALLTRNTLQQVQQMFNQRWNAPS